MATIFLSMAGEGRGHATRMHAIIHALRGEHRFVVFAPHDAYDYLSGLYSHEASDVCIERVAGMKFRYATKRIDLAGSCGDGLWFAAREIPNLVRYLQRRIDEERPALAITDFEPALPRAAVRSGVPFLSIDHQHMLIDCDMRDLPLRLRNYARLIGLVVRMWHPPADITVLSSFFHPPLKSGRNAVQIGPLLRPEILEARPENGDHILSYLRPHTPGRVLELLATCRREVRVYGLGNRPSVGTLWFHELNAQTFADDLSSCAGLVAAAGHQLLSEALYLGKPVLALPEERHHEQEINGFYLQKMGGGNSISLNRLNRIHVEEFLDRMEEFESNLKELTIDFDGTRAVANLIHSIVGSATPAQMASAPADHPSAPVAAN